MQRLQNGQVRSALALHGKVADKLDEKDSMRLAPALKSARVEVDADDWIARNRPNEGRREARQFWEAKGYSPEAASVMAGHEEAESGFNPKAINPKDGRDGSDSIGIFQWNGPRSKALLQFARENNLDPYERKTQREFAARELETTEAASGAKLRNAKSLEEANSAAFGYLRPAKQTGRLDLAQAALNDKGVGSDKKDRTEATKLAGEDFAALKTAGSNGVRLDTLTDKARGVVDTFVAAGDFAKAREVQDWFNAQVGAQSAGQAPAAQLSQAAADMKGRIESGEQSNAAIQQLDALENVKRQQAAAFAKDALTAGSTIYSRDLGSLPPATDFAGRVAYAEQISRRQGGLKVLPFTEPEIAQIRVTLENAPPEQQARTMQALAQIPAEHIPGIATALAGKGAGDQLSRSYAAERALATIAFSASVSVRPAIFAWALAVSSAAKASPSIFSTSFQSSAA